MRSLSTWSIAALLLLAGCQEGDPGMQRWEPRDSGVWQPLTGFDASAMPPPPPTCDYVLPPVPTEALPRCTSDTAGCVAACELGEPGNTCRNACLAADTTPPGGDGAPGSCTDCVFQQVFACVADNGCAAEVQSFYCCLIDRCSAGDDECAGTMCAEQVNTMFICGGMNAPGCFDFLEPSWAGACFADAPPPMDAGVSDAGAPDAGAPDAGAPDGGV